MKDFRGKVVVITGAGSGIGKATALAFAKEGALLHITDVNQDRLDKAAKEIKAVGAQVTTYLVDSGDRAAMEQFAKEVFAKAGRVDVLHNNAGIGMGGKIEEIPLEHWERIVRINFWGVVYGIHFFLPGMIAQGGGHIVNTASGAGLIGVAGCAHYCSTKFAVVGLSEVMNQELPRYNIYTTALCPGVIRTNIVQDAVFQAKTEKDKDLKAWAIKTFDLIGVSPNKVGQAVLKAVRKRRAVQVVPAWHMYPVWFLKRLSVSLYQFLARVAAQRILHD